ncbi:hypothetical protein ACFOPN_16520 [Xanthomonas hyacinthi]|uniref:hypothetical protein n=1 Tax=Xanthomonas hyacinthi TaxID=56455 RepID=UPI000A62F928|nr:hypothetical protein [Xanthomonas hyacinthi]
MQQPQAADGPPPGTGSGDTPSSQTRADADTLDLTGERSSDTPAITPRLGDDYDPRPHEDQARRHIAYMLIGLLWVVVAGLLILVAWSGIQVQDIKEFAVLLGPVVTLVSAATGFYYGTKSK